MNASLVIAAVLVALVATAGAASPLDELRMNKKALEFLRGRMFPGGAVRVQFGHFFHAVDPATRAYASGWSTSTPWAAYASCQRAGAKYDIKAPCLPLVLDGIVVARSYDQARDRAGEDSWEKSMWTDPLRCGQEPGDRFFWLEYGFCDVKRHGPDHALGVIIWNHGIAGTMVQYTAPPAMVLRLAQARGWDVIKINRHNQAEDARSYQRGEQRTLDEIQAQRARGYKKIVVAGQSFGGRVALEIGTRSEDVFAAVAFAPGMETTVGDSRDQAPTDRRLRASKVERLAVVFPGADALFGHIQRGRTAAPILAARAQPWLMFDESAGLSGHGGATGGNFALRHGRCLVDFLSAERVPGGRFDCPTGDAWSVATNYLPPVPREVRVARPDARIPGSTASLGGRWYGVIGESIVSWALVETDNAELSVLCTWADAGSRGGGVYVARLEGKGVQTTFANGATLTVVPLGPDIVSATWTPAVREANFSMHASSSGPLTGELRRVSE